MATSIRSGFRGRLLLLCTVFALASTALGGMITVQVTGMVDDSSFSSIKSNPLVTGFYTYDDALAPILDPGGTRAWYQGTAAMPITVFLAFADGSSIGTDEGEIMIHNNTVSDPDTLDIYAVGFDLEIGEGTRTGALVGYRVYGWFVGRSDPTALAWDSLALPDPEIVLERLPDDAAQLISYDADHHVGYITLHTTDLSVVPVPLPGAVALGAIGLACCRPLCRRRVP